MTPQKHMTRRYRNVRTLFALLAWALYLPGTEAANEMPKADKASCAVNAEETFEDNDSAYHLSEAVVSAKLKNREVMAPQTLSGEALKRMSNLSVADALRYFSGLQLKDYGGIGGIKTVNIRSMGTHHLGIAYDGVALGNAQNGQIDLGQFSLDNVEEVALYNGQIRLSGAVQAHGKLAPGSKLPDFKLYTRPSQVPGGPKTDMKSG